MIKMLNLQKTFCLFITLTVAFLLTGCDKGPVNPDNNNPVSLNQDFQSLRLTEIHYHPLELENYPDDSLEFIEIKNIGSNPIDLTNLRFTEGIDFVFPSGSTIAPKDFFVIASNRNVFQKRYGFEPDGVYSGQLKNSGETIIVQDRKAVIDLFSITYSDGNPWPKEADGTGRSLVPVQSDPSPEKQNYAASWRASFLINGSPGKDDPDAVFINEVLTHTDPPEVDAIELYNPGTADIDLGGWFLSDDITIPAKYRIADNTIIKAGGYIVFTENDFNTTSAFTSFKFSEDGEEAVLSADSTGSFGYCHSISFGALERGISFGRYIVPSNGNEVFVPLANVTPGSQNSDPLIGPLVISEFMCQSSGGKASFVEILNTGNQEIRLYDPDYPDNTWRLQIDTSFFSIPKGKSVKSGESFVMLFGTTEIESFRSSYSVSAGTQIFAYTTPILINSSLKIELEKPMEPNKDTTGALISEKTKYMEYDKVSCKNEAPWPVVTAYNTSLTRISVNKFGNDPANWNVSAPTPGRIE